MNKTTVILALTLAVAAATVATAQTRGVSPRADAEGHLGRSDLRWNNLYAVTSTVDEAIADAFTLNGDRITAWPTGDGGNWWTNKPTTAIIFTTNSWAIGQPYLRSNDGTNFYWVNITGAGGDFLADGSIPMTGNLDFGGNKGTNMADGIIASDAVTVGQLASFVTTQETARVLDWTLADILIKNGTVTNNPVTYRQLVRAIDDASGATLYGTMADNYFGNPGALLPTNVTYQIIVTNNLNGEGTVLVGEFWTTNLVNVAEGNQTLRWYAEKTTGNRTVYGQLEVITSNAVSGIWTSTPVLSEAIGEFKQYRDTVYLTEPCSQCVYGVRHSLVFVGGSQNTIVETYLGYPYSAHVDIEGGFGGIVLGVRGATNIVAGASHAYDPTTRTLIYNTNAVVVDALARVAGVGYLTAESDPNWAAVSNTVTTGAAAGATALQAEADTLATVLGRGNNANGLSITNILNVIMGGYWQALSGLGTNTITSTAYGASQVGQNIGVQTIGDISYGARQSGRNTGTRTIGDATAGAEQIGYCRGNQTIGDSSYGAMQRGYTDGAASATNNAVGAVQLHDLTAGQVANTTSGGAGSLLLGAGTASNRYAIVAGDGNVSHGDGTVTANGYWIGTDKVETVVTSIVNSATQDIITNIVYAAQDGITRVGPVVSLGTNLFSGGGGAVAGDWWTNKPSTLITFTTNAWALATPYLKSIDGTNFYWVNIEGAGGDPVDARAVTNNINLAGYSITNGIFVGDGSGLTNIVSSGTVDTNYFRNADNLTNLNAIGTSELNNDAGFIAEFTNLFSGASTTGLVTSTSSDTNKYLKGDGTWGEVTSGENVSSNYFQAKGPDSQSLSGATWTKLTCSNEVSDTSGVYNPATATFTAQNDSTWLFVFGAWGTPRCWNAIYVNGENATKPNLTVDGAHYSMGESSFLVECTNGTTVAFYGIVLTAGSIKDAFLQGIRIK